jgi:hypothetical protein
MKDGSGPPLPGSGPPPPRTELPIPGPDGRGQGCSELCDDLAIDSEQSGAESNSCRPDHETPNGYAIFPLTPQSSESSVDERKMHSSSTSEPQTDSSKKFRNDSKVSFPQEIEQYSSRCSAICAAIHLHGGLKALLPD